MGDPQALTGSPPFPSLTSNIDTTNQVFLMLFFAVVICFTFTFVIALIQTTLSMLVCYLSSCTRNHDMNDHEAGDTSNDPASSQQDAESPAPVRNITLLQILLVEVLDRRRVESEEVRGQQQNLRNLDLLPPAINYRRQDITSSHSEIECAICLEEFIDGESCRVFHACKHLFHSACIDNWLRLNPSCPICRNYLIDA
ncbi:RING-H2 finger protein ATL67-like [Juglans microcarpa x Juglans regia]|uniref:RING-H2 finger protein ATL67-like n=1 Tax=Juglans microcarpa x Juglans regia TaxID=2249226 RepID=UPI001B7DAACB|nr:RING-H2 finger protein ATL67-like [Juglans microcarpa x Juglans regia]